VRRLVPAVVLAALVASGAAVSAGASDEPPPADPGTPPPAAVTPSPDETPSPSPSPDPVPDPVPPPPPPPPAPPAKARTAVTLAVAPSRVVTGRTVTLSGVAGPVRSSRIVPLKGARITLQVRAAGTTRWTAVRVITTTTGSYRFAWRYPLRTSSVLRAVLSARTATASAVSPSRSVTRVLPPPAPRAYPNCAALNRVYPHGVGRPGAVDRTSGTRVTTFTRDAATYRLNPGRDRDKDGIACEKR
jgi:outer membrane biosynthesis protein TonB